MKDDLLDEDLAKKQDLDQETTENKLDKMDTAVDSLQTRFARLLGEISSTQAKLKERLAKLETFYEDSSGAPFAMSDEENPDKERDSNQRGYQKESLKK